MTTETERERRAAIITERREGRRRVRTTEKGERRRAMTTESRRGRHIRGYKQENEAIHIENHVE